MTILNVLKHSYYNTRNELFIKYRTRGMVKKLQRKYNGRPLIGVEIGTSMGYHALMLLHHNNISKLYLIDSYKEYADFEMSYEGKKNFKTHNDETYNDEFIFAQRLLKKYNDKIVFIRKFSADAIHDIPDNVDFVYIDANHTYGYVKNDIELYYPKVVDSGIIGGHDFTPAYGVPYAVLEFAEENGLLERLDGGKLDWWIDKEVDKVNE